MAKKLGDICLLCSLSSPGPQILTQNIRENGQILSENEIWQGNKSRSSDVRTDLSDLAITLSRSVEICPKSEKKNSCK